MPVPVPDKVAAARKQVHTSDFFALCFLMLSQLAYADANSAASDVQQITNLLSTMPVPQAVVQGMWIPGWGPHTNPENSNLMYAAEFLDSMSGLPVFSVVVIRGTDTSAKPSGVIKQLTEDLDATNQTVFPPGNQVGSKIARGSQDGLNTLLQFVDTSQRTVEQYLHDFVAKNPEAPVVVTGHSLGGCLTTVMALHLSGKLPAQTKIVPNSFAAPTAGNQAFVDLYEQTFPFCPRWFNPLDLVPMAYAGLSSMRCLWDQCHHPAPEAFKLVTEVFQSLLAALHDGYAQQSAVNSRSLGGACQPPSAPAATKAPMAEVVREIQDCVRHAAARGNVPVTDSMFHGIGDWVKELLFQHLVPTGYWNAVADWRGVAKIRNPFVQAAGAGGNP